MMKNSPQRRFMKYLQEKNVHKAMSYPMDCAGLDYTSLGQSRHYYVLERELRENIGVNSEFTQNDQKLRVFCQNNTLTKKYFQCDSLSNFITIMILLFPSNYPDCHVE